MVVRNCKKLLADLHELEEKMDHLTKSYPDLDPDYLLELILKTQG